MSTSPKRKVVIEPNPGVKVKFAQLGGSEKREHRVLLITGPDFITYTLVLVFLALRCLRVTSQQQLLFWCRCCYRSIARPTKLQDCRWCRPLAGKLLQVQLDRNGSVALLLRSDPTRVRLQDQAAKKCAWTYAGGTQVDYYVGWCLGWYARHSPIRSKPTLDGFV